MAACTPTLLLCAFASLLVGTVVELPVALGQIAFSFSHYDDACGSPTSVDYIDRGENNDDPAITALTTDSNILYFQNTSVFGFGERDWGVIDVADCLVGPILPAKDFIESTGLQSKCSDPTYGIHDQSLPAEAPTPSRKLLTESTQSVKRTLPGFSHAGNPIQIEDMLQCASATSGRSLMAADTSRPSVTREDNSCSEDFNAGYDPSVIHQSKLLCGCSGYYYWAVEAEFDDGTPWTGWCVVDFKSCGSACFNLSEFLQALGKTFPDECKSLGL